MSRLDLTIRQPVLFSFTADTDNLSQIGNSVINCTKMHKKLAGMQARLSGPLLCLEQCRTYTRRSSILTVVMPTVAVHCTAVGMHGYQCGVYTADGARGSATDRAQMAQFLAMQRQAKCFSDAVCELQPFRAASSAIELCLALIIQSAQCKDRGRINR